MPNAARSREATMRLAALAMMAGAALATLTVPASAAWRGYISHPLGFAFAAPGELKLEKGTYRAAVAGTRDTLVYRFAGARPVRRLDLVLHGPGGGGRDRAAAAAEVAAARPGRQIQGGRNAQHDTGGSGRRRADGDAGAGGLEELRQS